uniref:Terminase n=1 Tax=Micrococcus phage Olihed TaxID=3092209 RepID=A0AAU6R5X4_9CAUD
MKILTPKALADFATFCYECGIRDSELTKVLTAQIDPEALLTPLSCTALSTPPQEGKTTWVAHFIAWQLIRNPRLNVIYASYSQFRANSVSRLVRSIVDRFTPLPRGAKTVGQWRTRKGGGLLAAGRGTGVTGFSCDLLVIDDPIKDMKEAQSEVIRETTKEWFSSVLITRMASLSQIIVVCTRWHKDDLIAHVVKELDAEYINIPAQASSENDPLGRKPEEWLKSVQNRSPESWGKIKSSVGTYVWQALYQGDPQVTGGSYIDIDKIDVMPWDQVVWKDQRGFMMTLDRALVIQSWDLAFTGKGDYVAGQVWANIAGTWIMVDRVHERLTFTQTVSRVQQMAARWPQTSRIYVENAANGAALLDTLKKRAALIKPVTPRGSKEARALAVQPTVDAGQVKVVDSIWDPELFQEWKDFPFAKHDDQVDAMTQALLSGKEDYFTMGS